MPTQLPRKGGPLCPPLLYWCLGLALLSSVLAGPTLMTIYPRGAGIGETVEVEFIGGRLLDPIDVVLYDTGIKFLGFSDVTEKSIYRRYDGKDVHHDMDKRVVAKLRIAADARQGEHHMRLVTESGMTELRTFWVGAFPSVRENEDYKERNDEPAGAFAVLNLPVTVNGTLFRNDIDTFRISGRKGQRLGAEIECIRLANHPQGGITDLGLTLRDANGTVVAENGDSAMFLADPMLSARLPADGDYFLTVATEIAGYDNQPAYYRLHLGDFERKLPYPAGGTSPRVENELPTPNTYMVSAHPNLLESEPNNTPEEANTGSFPLALNGRMDSAGDVDVFRFAVGPEHAGTWHVRLHGQSIDSSIDGELVWHIYEAKKDRWKSSKRGTDSRGEAVGFVRLDSRVSELLDPVMSVSIPSGGGEFAVEVRDAHNRGGENFVYRVEFTRPMTGVITHIPPYGNDSSLQLRNRLELPQGNATPTWVSAKPEWNFKWKGDLRLTAKGLPPGVVMEAPILEAGKERVPVIFRADREVPIGGYLIEILAEPVEPVVGFQSRFQQVNNFHSRQSGNCIIHTRVDKLALAITKPAPFSIQVDQPEAALIQNGEFSIPFHIHREKGFTEPIEVTMEMIPPNVSKATPVKMKVGDTEGSYLMSANSRAEAGAYEVLLTAMSGDSRNMRYGAGDYVLASDLFQIQIGKPYITARLSRAAIEQGKDSVVVAKLEHMRPLKGKAQITLKGLPSGIKLLSESIQVTSDTTEVSFKIQADLKALFGMNRGLHCIVEIEEKGEVLKQKTGYGFLRIDPERKKVSAR